MQRRSDDAPTIDEFTLAAHEAGHAVMRWLRTGKATAVWINPKTGDGYSEGTGQPMGSRDALLIALAGIAVESGYGLAGIDCTKTKTSDIDEARAIIEANPHLGSWHDVDAGIGQALGQACELLRPHMDLVEALAIVLEDKHALTADEVREICARNTGANPFRPQGWR